MFILTKNNYKKKIKHQQLKQDLRSVIFSTFGESII